MSLITPQCYVHLFTDVDCFNADIRRQFEDLYHLNIKTGGIYCLMLIKDGKDQKKRDLVGKLSIRREGGFTPISTTTRIYQIICGMPKPF